jgi:hypothetical protein
VTDDRIFADFFASVASVQTTPPPLASSQLVANNCAPHVLAPFTPLGYLPPMPDADKLAPADPSDLASALAFALRFHGRKRVHNADEIISEIVARRA